MAVVVITPPTADWLALADLKRHVRAEDFADDDALIGLYGQAVASHLDGPETWLGRSLGPQTLELRLPRFPCGAIALPCPPVIDVLSVRYLDAEGTDQVLAPDLYEVLSGGRVIPAYGESFPSGRVREEGVRIRYRAGYAVDPEAEPLTPAVPPAIKAAAMLMVGDLYARRQTAADGPVTAIPMSAAVQNLLSPYRVWT